MKYLPNKVGQGHSWLVIQDETVKLEDIVNKFHILSQKTVSYQEGIQCAYQDSRWIGIADLGMGEFYLFEGLVNYLIWEKDELEKFSKGWKKVVLFLINPAKNEYAFSVAENGEIKRSYYVCEEEAVFDFFGKPLEEEIELELNLPEEDIYTVLSSPNHLEEEKILKLAVELIGREEAFVYQDVVLLRVGLLR